MLLALMLPLDAGAQGRGRPKRPPPAVEAGSGEARGPTNGGTLATAGPFRQFGAWLDDASTLAARQASTGIGIGYWRLSGGSQVDVPMLDGAYGVTDRLQIAASVPFYRVNYGGATAHGLDDVYLSAKIAAIDPDGNGRFGVAVIPLIEILSGADDGRLHWGLPVSIEARRESIRVYGSAGYFSRGAGFAGGAVEWSASSGTTLTGALVHSFSTGEDSIGARVDSNRHRGDVTLGIAHPMTDASAAYVTIGRSLTGIEDGGAGLGLGAGVSFAFGRSAPP